MLQRIALTAAVLASALSSQIALAGILDTPLPELLPGKKTYHVYTVPGFVVGGNGMTTVFSCTSLEKTATIQVGVQCFSRFGIDTNDPVGTSLSLTPGGSEVFATRDALAFSVSSVVGGGSTTAGSARILATSTKIACTAFVADIGNVPPASAWQLTIVKKAKQKGD